MPARPRAKLKDQPASPVEASRRTLALSLAGALLCYLAHPPVGWGLLAWVGPAPWLLLARLPQMPGRRPYAAIWLGGMAFWLAAIQWIRLPHWANHFGLLLLAAYLGAYLPVFVALTRVAVHRLRVPLWLAAPIAWTGLEWLRARLLTGFLMASLAHTQIRFPLVIQIADVFGEYGVTFLIMLVAASIADVLPLERFVINPPSEPGRPRPRRLALLELTPAAVAIVATLSYGAWRLQSDVTRSPQSAAAKPGVTIALIQSDMLADWKGDSRRDALAMQQLVNLSREAVHQSKRPVDLIVWPETMFRITLHQSEGDYRPPHELFEGSVDRQFAAAVEYLSSLARDLNVAVLVGLDRSHWRAPGPDAKPIIEGLPPFHEDCFNSSALVDRQGKLIGTYDKMHLLPFGEFIPFVSWLPFLRDYSPITGLAIPGRLPEPLIVDGVSYSVDICYETVLPHLICEQFTHLIDEKQSTPDVMVNLTNDAWYWGSSELDMHLASGVFRAVEMRTPLVVAANRGLSAYIDSLGRVVQVTERNKPAYLVAQVRLPLRSGAYPSLFAAYGDWLPFACLLCCVVPALVGGRQRWNQHRRE